MSTYHRYAEDLTGKNPDNLVAGELKSLSDRPIRAVVPSYGPFFVDSLQVYDNVTKRKLDKGIDYDIPVISQEAVIRTGLAVADAYLITNPKVSSQVMHNYQAIGGLFQNDVSNIISMYESYMKDNRSVDWLTGVFGKPLTYTPSEHPSWMANIYGFEPLTFELERIAQAIQIGQTPAYQAIIDSFSSKFATDKDVDAGLPVDRLITLRHLLYALDKYNFNSMSIEPQWDWIANGGSLWVTVRASNVPRDAVYYWTIEHGTTDNSDFSALSGQVPLNQGVGQFMIQATMTAAAEEEERFHIAIRRNGPVGQVVGRSWPLRLLAHPAFKLMTLLDGYKTCCMTSPTITRTALTTSIIGSRANATYN